MHYLFTTYKEVQLSKGCDAFLEMLLLCIRRGNCQVCKFYKEVQDLWQNLNILIRTKLSIHIDLSDSRKLLGYEEYDTHYIIHTKYNFKINKYSPPPKEMENKFQEQKTRLINQTKTKVNKNGKCGKIYFKIFLNINMYQKICSICFFTLCPYKKL